MNNISHSCIAEIEHHNTFETLFENSLDGILIIEDGSFVLCNQTIVQMLGYNSKEDLLNLHPSKLSPEFQPDGRRSYEKAEEMIQLAIKNGKHRFTWVHSKANNEDISVEVTLTPITLNNRNVIHVVWKDISKEKETLEALKASKLENQHLKERMELALLGNKDGLWDWNILDDSVYFSTRWKEMLGYRDDEIENIFSSWESHVHPEEFSEVMVHVENSLEKKTEYFEHTYRMKHKDGHWIWILDRGKVLFNEDGKAYRMIGTHTDVTADKNIQLRYTHQAQMIEQIHDAIVPSDLEGIITGWNKGAEILLGYKPDEIIGRHLRTIHLKEDEPILKENIEILMKNGNYHTELRLVKKSKEILFTEVSLSVLKDEKQKPMGMVGYVKDITKRKNAEDALRKQKDILQYQAHHDYLTGLPNRVLFNDRLEHGIEKASRDQRKLALLFIDLDHFKEINDSLGHEVGDKALKATAKQFQSCIRTSDTLARLGGDEFIIILEDLNKEENASLLAQKILEITKQPIKVDEHLLYISTSIGISLYPSDTTNNIHLLQYADMAMYQAKTKGRNNFQFYKSV